MAYPGNSPDLHFHYGSSAFVRLWKKKRSGAVSTSDMVTQVPREMLHEISEIPGAWTKIVQSVQREFGEESIEELEKAAREQRLKNKGINGIPLSELSHEDLEDEEMIKQFILKSGARHIKQILSSIADFQVKDQHGSLKNEG